MGSISVSTTVPARTFAKAAAVVALIVGASAPGVSFAVNGPPAPTPGSVYVSGALTVGGQTTTLNMAGSGGVNVNANTYGSIYAMFGADPKAYVSFQSNGLSSGSIDQHYDVVYADAGFSLPNHTPFNPTVNVNITASDTLSTLKGTASDYLDIQGESNFDYPYYVSHCVSDISGCGGGSGAPITSKSIAMVINEVYRVYIHVSASGEYGTALVDPTFQAPVGTPGGHFIFSPSVSAVPEAATWTLMLVGVGATGAMARRRKGGAVSA